jgi:hyaluronan synthase
MSYFVIYGILALSHILIQLVFGQLHYLRHRRHLGRDEGFATDRTVTVVVPVYNEATPVLRQCLESIAGQDHPALEVIVVDDGSANQHEHEVVYRDFAALPGWTVLEEPENRGKRLAQKLAFDRAAGDVVVTIDSDTILRTPDAIRKIQRSFSDPAIGAVTGDVRVANRHVNLLTRLIGYRYWMAFHQERAAQSLFGVMMCCSGPFSAFRGDLVRRLKERYVNQRFLGGRCSFGDDRHLTNLVLREGYRAVFDEEAEARTHVPTNLRSYLCQQVRWNKSFYREALWTARFAHRRNPYLALELLFQLALPFMLMAAVVSVAYRSAFVDVDYLWTWGLVVAGIAVLRSTYGLLRTKELGFLMFLFYGFIHLVLLVPTRLYALATLGRGHWGTRTPPKDPPPPTRARVFRVATAISAVLLVFLSTGFRKY